MYEKDYNEDEVELHIVIFKDEQLYSIEDEKECLLVELENESWIENDDLDTNWEWEVYEDGRYCENHTNLSIFELDVE